MDDFQGSFSVQSNFTHRQARVHHCALILPLILPHQSIIEACQIEDLSLSSHHIFLD